MTCVLLWSMITTNLPQFVHQLNTLSVVNVHDHDDSIEVRVSKPVNVLEVDDLVCDALFVDPVRRLEGTEGWTIHLLKRDNLRSAADMRVVNGSGYIVQPAA